jgi:ribosomal protein S12 methylthiotransferase accessory factor
VTATLDLLGTRRTRSPQDTWLAAAPLLRRFGISRVADVTDLDIIGIPVWMAIRPAAQTVSASQGKGADHDMARLSAVMEAIEVAVAEDHVPDVTHRGAAARLGLPYPVRALPRAATSMACDSLVTDWTVATIAGTSETVPVPASMIGIHGLAANRWNPQLFTDTTNGLASGNTVPEAALHGLFELVERHSIARAAGRPVHDQRRVSLAAVEDGLCRSLLQAFAEAGVWVEVTHVTELASVPCFIAYVWSSDMPSLHAGSGAHSVAAIALSRALTEAAQSRLSVISGVREDIPDVAYGPVLGAIRHPGSRDRAALAQGPIASATEAGPGVAGIEEELAAVAAAVTDLTGYPVLVYDLTPDDVDIAVVRVIAPGLTFEGDAAVSRRSGPC